MNTYSILPPVHLSHLIRNVIWMEDELSPEILSCFPFYADGCPGIMYQESASGMSMHGGEGLFRFFYYGQTVQPITITVKGSYRIIVVRFYPYITKSLFGFSSIEFKDECLDLSLLPFENIAEQLQNTGTAALQLELIFNYLTKMVRSKRVSIDDGMHFAVSHILKTRNLEKLKGIWNQLYLSERTFQRRFEQHVGVSAKLFARISQFRNALDQLQNGRFERLTDIAFENGYADQSHFIRSFKEFTGKPPTQYSREPAGVFEASRMTGLFC